MPTHNTPPPPLASPKARGRPTSPATVVVVDSPYDRAVAAEILNTTAAVRALEELDAQGGALARPQIAQCWGITQQAVDLMSRRPDFPRPWLTFGRSGLYLYAEVLAWRRRDLDRPGKPGPPPPGAEAIRASPTYDVAAARRAAARVLTHGGLANAAQLGQRYGITRQAIQRHADRPGFPTPRAHAGTGGAPLYLLAETDAWNRARGGPPPQAS